MAICTFDHNFEAQFFRLNQFSKTLWSRVQSPESRVHNSEPAFKCQAMPPVAPPPPAPTTNPPSHRKNSHSAKFQYCWVWLTTFYEYFLLCVFSLKGRLCLKCCFNDPSRFPLGSIVHLQDFLSSLCNSLHRILTKRFHKMCKITQYWNISCITCCSEPHGSIVSLILLSVKRRCI